MLIGFVSLAAYVLRGFSQGPTSLKNWAGNGSGDLRGDLLPWELGEKVHSK